MTLFFFGANVGVVDTKILKMGQSDSREPKIQPEGQTVNVRSRDSTQRDGFTAQEAKDYCEKIKEEVNKDTSCILHSISEFFSLLIECDPTKLGPDFDAARCSRRSPTW